MKKIYKILLTIHLLIFATHCFAGDESFDKWLNSSELITPDETPPFTFSLSSSPESF